jgi:protein SCO1/2
MKKSGCASLGVPILGNTRGFTPLIAVQRAFDVYRGDKMNHSPVTFLRAGAGKPWVRMAGFASAADILREYRQLNAR